MHLTQNILHLQQFQQLDHQLLAVFHHPLQLLQTPLVVPEQYPLFLLLNLTEVVIALGCRLALLIVIFDYTP